MSVQRRNLLLLIAASMIAGAALFWLVTGRYSVFAAGGGAVMKVDRWTGKAWSRSSVYHGTVLTQVWKPVEEQ